MSGSILYAAACVLVPVGWGLLVWAASNLVEQKLRGRRAEDPQPIAQDDQV